MSSQPPADGQRIKEYERRFRRVGLPLLIADYSAFEDIFTRALPFLIITFVLACAGAANLDWSLAANAASIVSGLVLLICVFGVVNRLSGRRFFSLPRRVRWPELAVYVIAPAVLPLIFGGQIGLAALTLVGQLAVLAVVYVVVGLGLISILRWSLARLLGQLVRSLPLLTRAIPILLVFAVVLFINTEMWQVFDSLPRNYTFLIILLFAGLGTLFLVARLPQEVRLMESELGEGQPPLSGLQRFNVLLVMLVSQTLQVALVMAAIFAFFVAFGLLAMQPQVIEDWIKSPPEVLLSFDFFGSSIEVTVELLRVAGGIAAFSGLYFAIAVLTDSNYREEFGDGFASEVRETFVARGEYLRLYGQIQSQAQPSSGADPS